MNTSLSARPSTLGLVPPQPQQTNSPTAKAVLAISKILVPIDFSPHANKALAYATELAARFNAEVTLVHVIEQLVYPGDWMVPMLTTSNFGAETRALLEERLNGMTKGKGMKVKHAVRFGRAWQEIVEIARERGTDLIVIGTHGYTGLRHVLLGSVAEKVLRHATCPVLAIRAEEDDFS